MMKVAKGQALDDATRAALASGRTDPALALFIDSLMEMRGLSAIDGCAVAGALLEAESPAEMAPDALDRVFAAIKKGAAPQAPSAYPELIKLPAGLADAIRDAEARTGWRARTPGIRGLVLDIGGDARAEVFRIEPGAASPRHTHKGNELTLCLLGGFSDELGSYGPGDVSITDPSITHQPRADDDGVCFVLAVTDAGLKFEGVLGAIQKLTGG